MPGNDHSFYRFRSIDALLGKRSELERQEIYFASPSQLNDPMEGYKDIRWNGDKIVWRNLMKHYLLCLVRQLSLIIVARHKYEPDLSKNIIFSSTIDNLDPKFVLMFEEICQTFFGENGVEQIPELLAQCTHKIRREELNFYITSWHSFAVLCISHVFQRYDLIPSNTTSAQHASDIRYTIVLLLNMLAETKKERLDHEKDAIRRLFEAAGQISKTYEIKRILNASKSLKKIWTSAIEEFPARYVEALDRLIFFDWYAACFVSNPNQAAMSGNYADCHRGVCLEFQGQENCGDADQLSLQTQIADTGLNGKPRFPDGIKLPFLKMSYVHRFPEVDFFRSLGRLSRSTLDADWYKGKDGDLSECADGLRGLQGRQLYFDRFKEMITSKFSDWRHEDEYRLVLYSAFDDFSNDSNRALKFNFADLKSIIFGIKTSDEDKKRVVEIIRQKCVESGRKNFSFSQSYYSGHLGKIDFWNHDIMTF